MAKGPLCIYAHRIKGDSEPFYYGSGLPNRPENFKRGPDWRAYVERRLGPDYMSRLDEVEVAWRKSFECEGRMRYEECMLAARNNAAGNRVGAARASPDMLTGLLKGAKPCTCGTPECRRREWLSMSEARQDEDIRLQLTLANRNREARGETPIKIDAKMREYRKRRSEGHHWFTDKT